MRLLRSFLGLAAIVVTAGPAFAAERDFPIVAFDRVESSVPFDVRVRAAPAPNVRASGSQEVLDRLDITVRGGVLHVEMQRGRFSWSGRRERVLIEVAAPVLRAAALNGPGDLTIDRVAAPRFAATLSGPGNLTIAALDTRELAGTLNGPGDLSVAGRADRLALSLSGPGNVRANRLVAREATLLLSGPGDISATVTGIARGTLSGPGNITISGGARCDITKRGPGEVRCR